MRVISQKKDYSVEFEHVPFWMQNNLIYAKVEQDNIVFGAYETNERAKEVFRDMHNAYAPVGIIATNLNKAQIEQFIGSLNVEMKVIQMNEPYAAVTAYGNYAYWMPEV